MINLDYRADLLGNIQQALTGLQGFEVMALELVQNADDAGAAKLVFDVRDDALVVRNDAGFTSCGLTTVACPWEHGGDPEGALRPCNFHAISLMGARSKIRTGSQIGRFGIGFVSVYQITDEPVIRSAGVEMRLDPYLGKSITSTIPLAPVTEFELRWASAPSRVRTGLNASITPDDVVPTMAAAIADVMSRGLLFLRHLQRVELHQNGVLQHAVTLARTDEVVTLSTQPAGDSQTWQVLRKDARALVEARGLYTDYPALVDLDRSTEVQLAIPLGDEPIDGRLYAYLPTDQSSRLPLHINADFFPHSNRRAIVLDGRQHDRPWNEILLETAADAIAENFESLRQALGHRRLWVLGGAAYAMRDTRAFEPFWKQFSAAAAQVDSIWTIKEEWRPAGEALLAAEVLTADQKIAVADLGLDILHEDLRGYYNALQTLGAKPLRLPVVIDRLDAGFTTTDAPTVSLVPLWQALDYLGANPGQPPFVPPALVDRLKAIPFCRDVDGARGALRDLWRPAEGVTASDVRTYIPGCRFADPQILSLGWLGPKVAEYAFDDLARDLAATITSVDVAERVIGLRLVDAERFYGLLSAFEVKSDGLADSLLAETPILRTGIGFAAPSRVQMPGGFIDPIGHFDLMDMSIVDDRMRRVARDGLGVGVLTFQAYVEDHLEAILEGQPSLAQYRELLIQIARNSSHLDVDGGIRALAKVAFVRNRVGGWSRPRDCYYWSPTLEALLGEEGSHWVDEGWMPPGADGARLRDLFEVQLGMETRVSMADAVARIGDVVAPEWSEPAIRIVNRVTRYILERFASLSPEQRLALRPLQTLKWLPASLNGDRLPEPMAPNQIYRSFRATGFSTQVPVVDLPVMRGTQARFLVDFLEFLEMPAEPPTAVIVAHLQACMAANAPAQDTVYAMLQERLTDGDSEVIDTLKDRACIYDSDKGRYYLPRDVFWIHPPFGGRWRNATERMRTRMGLYSRLGVKEAPTAEDYAHLLVEIGRQGQVGPEDAAVHAQCLLRLATDLEIDPSVEVVLGEIADGPVLLNLLDASILPDAAVWLDSEALSTPFQGGLDAHLVRPPAVPRSTAARLFRALGCAPLSEAARLTLANEPDRAPEDRATAALHDRADLLLWLAPTPEVASALREILAGIRVVSTLSLQVRSELFRSEPPIPSSPSAANAFLDGETLELHVRAEPGSSADWPSIFRAIFAQLERYTHGLDIPPLVMTASYVVSIATREEAKLALTASEFKAPVAQIDPLPAVEAIGDAAPDVEDDAVLEDGDVTALEDQAGDQHDTMDDPSSSAIVDDAIEPISGETSAQPGPADYPAGDTGGEAWVDQDVVDEADVHEPQAEPRGGQEDFTSRRGSGEFGAESSPSNGAGQQPGSSGGGGSGGGSGGGWTGSRRVTHVDGEVRRSRMLAYVVTETHDHRTSDDDRQEQADRSRELNARIDAAAVAAVIDYERARGWAPQEQPHGNPGFDVISMGPSGGRRLIEIKGLHADWTARGIKLSSVQFSTAQAYPGEYWIYVVEQALDADQRAVTAIANPFSKVAEYWFDDGWRGVAEDRPQPESGAIREGQRVRHETWGAGEIVEIHHGGLAPSVTVDFGETHGRRRVPATGALMILD
ncbi:MAG: DUF3883 domain-containing protein [Caulobacter sp.]|nr:DUF3883 domain-containing protein [Caulobacter sp.]